jgi:hypothetical protein
MESPVQEPLYHCSFDIQQRDIWLKIIDLIVVSDIDPTVVAKSCQFPEEHLLAFDEFVDKPILDSFTFGTC